MTAKVNVAPALISWARTRSRRDEEFLYKHFPRLDEWEAVNSTLTLSQLEEFARATYTPVGYFFLNQPPTEEMPIPDFRTIGDATVASPSADLLDMLSMCEQRQVWYRSYSVETGEEPVSFIGSMTIETDVEWAAEKINSTLRFDVDRRTTANGWTEALRLMSDRVEEAGILLMISGIVGSNTHRALDPDEFRGFVLVDDFAPLIFINGADTKAAQIFTLCHELAHIRIGQSALSNPDLVGETSRGNAVAEIETWCNRVAAEMLIPRSLLDREYQADRPMQEEMQRLAHRYKVSTLVVLRRLFDTHRLSKQDFRDAYERELAAFRDRKGSIGGSYYNSQPVRTSKRFARAIIRSAVEGRTLYRDAFQLLAIKSQPTFDELGRTLGVL